MYSFMQSLFAFITCAALLLFAGCHNPRPAQPVQDAAVLHNNQQQLTQVIIYDVFNPPVTSRIYAYSSLASYEAIRFSDKKYASLTARLHGFKAIPEPDRNKAYNYTLAATKAFFTVIRKMVFSVDSFSTYERNMYSQYKDALDDSVYSRSMAFGDTIGKIILQRAATDGYAASRGKTKYLGSDEAGKWRPTPPDYMDGVEWCWNTMKTFVLDSASQCKPPLPPAYSADTASAFFRQVKEVYDIGTHLTGEQKEIARYWDDNPFVMEHAGHMQFANKKITPAGHWMGITAIACKQSRADAVKTAQAYAAVAIALYEGFVSCWDEKYRSSYIRPVTVINEKIDEQWLPFLQTPPFPEYPSGHSTITRAAATVLTKLFGDHFSFQDTSDLEYIGMQRHFNSFIQAADEASISRVYGGIHYRNSVDAGAAEGRAVGEIVCKKLEF